MAALGRPAAVSGRPNHPMRSSQAGIFAHGNGQWHSRDSVQPGKAMTVKEMWLAVPTRQAFRLVRAVQFPAFCESTAMEFSQSTLEEIVESERLMFATAEQRYGRYYKHARGCSVFLSLCITGVNHNQMMFARFFAQMKKHHMLALLSTLRLHKVQAMMNLRQVLEAGAAAAFAIANPEQEHFAIADQQGILDPSQELTKKRYAWLNKNYEAKSQWIKEKKEQINLSTAHANIISADKVFRVSDSGDQVNSPFFDIEDEYFVKCDLWLLGCVALTLMDFFYGVNDGRNVIDFLPEFADSIERMATENNALLAEMKSTDRFKRAAEKYGM